MLVTRAKMYLFLGEAGSWSEQFLWCFSVCQFSSFLLPALPADIPVGTWRSKIIGVFFFLGDLVRGVGSGRFPRFDGAPSSVGIPRAVTQGSYHGSAIILTAAP